MGALVSKICCCDQTHGAKPKQDETIQSKPGKGNNTLQNVKIPQLSGPKDTNLHKFDEILKKADEPILGDLKDQVRTGIFLDQKKKKFWVEENGHNCFMLFARDLTIVWGEDERYFGWISENETRKMSDGSNSGDTGGAIPVATMTPSANDFLALMRQLIQQESRDNGQSSRAGQGNAQDLLKSFLSTKPDTFSGSSNPDDSYAWLQHVRKKLDAMKCPEEDKVRLATHMLSGRADSWWNLQKVGYEEKHPGETIPWNWFEEEFFKHHFPQNLRRARKQEFENLKQGNMSVQEYSEEWHRLSIFGGSSVVDVEERVARFIDGLHPELAIIVRPHSLGTISEVVNVAIGVERDRRQSYKMRMDRHEHRSKKPSRRAPYNFRGAVQTRGYELPPCSTCHRRHRGECFLKNRKCYNCDQTGHIANQCPNKGKYGSQRPPVSRPSQQQVGGSSNRPNNRATMYAVQRDNEAEVTNVIAGFDL